MLQPSHIVITPLVPETVSLISCAVLELQRQKHHFVILTITVVAPHLAPTTNTPPSSPTPSPLERNKQQECLALELAAPFKDTPYDVFEATIRELRSMQVNVRWDLPSPNKEPFTWLLDVNLASPSLPSYPSLQENDVGSTKICYLRPVEWMLSQEETSRLNLRATPENAVLVQYGLCIEDLMDWPASNTPLQVYPTNLTMISIFVVSILISQFIYRPTYVITGAPLSLPSLDPEGPTRFTPIEKSSMKLASGRTFEQLLFAFEKGLFEISSPDFKFHLHFTPPAWHLSSSQCDVQEEHEMLTEMYSIYDGRWLVTINMESLHSDIA